MAVWGVDWARAGTPDSGITEGKRRSVGSGTSSGVSAEQAPSAGPGSAGMSSERFLLPQRNGVPPFPPQAGEAARSSVGARRATESDWTENSTEAETDTYDYGRSDRGGAKERALSGNFVSSGASLVNQRRNLTRNLIPTYRVLQLAGFLPLISVETKLPHRRSTRLLLRRPRNPAEVASRVALYLLLATFLAYNAFAFYLFTNLAWRFQILFIDNGHLHALTVGSIIASVKPVINIFCFVLFGFRLWSHRRLLKRMGEVQRSYSTHFGSATKTFRASNIAMIGIVIFTFVTIFALRLSMYLEMGEEPGRFSNDLSLVSAPLLSVWNIIPLIYFLQCHVLVRQWGRQLAGNIRRNYRVPARIKRGFLSSPSVDAPRPPPKKDLKFYYRHFSQLADLQMAASEFFNPYIAFTFLWSMFTLCLTIYFVINAGDSYDAPPVALDEGGTELWRRVIHYNFGWVGIQIFLSLAHMLTICDAGRRTNEETRAIVSAVLQAMLDHEPTQQDQAFLSCFQGKIRLQPTWGASVWRAFPLERGSFLQLGTIIMSYAMILLKFRGQISVKAGDGTERETATQAPDSLANGVTAMANLTTELLWPSGAPVAGEVRQNASGAAFILDPVLDVLELAQLLMGQDYNATSAG